MKELGQKVAEKLGKGGTITIHARSMVLGEGRGVDNMIWAIWNVLH